MSGFLAIPRAALAAVGAAVSAKRRASRSDSMVSLLGRTAARAPDVVERAAHAFGYRVQVCTRCDRRGWVDGQPCSACDGQGWVLVKEGR